MKKKLSNEEKKELLMEAFYNSEAYNQFNKLGRNSSSPNGKALESYRSLFIDMSDSDTIDNHPVWHAIKTVVEIGGVCSGVYHQQQNPI